MSFLEEGHLLARYRVEAFLAEGGMGQIYRAVDTLLGTEFGATEHPWVVQAYARNSGLTASGDLTVSADSSPLINSTVSNTAKSSRSWLSSRR